MGHYELELKNDRTRSYHVLFLFFVFSNLIYFIIGLAVATKMSDRIISLSVVILCAGLFGYLYYSKKNYRSILLSATTIIIGVGYLFLNNWLLAIALFVTGLMYVIATRKLLVTVTNEGIIYPSFPKKTITWKEINNIILKDGIFTIDLKNNRIMQSEVAEIENKPAVIEQDFNEFCRNQMKIQLVSKEK